MFLNLMIIQYCFEKRVHFTKYFKEMSIKELKLFYKSRQVLLQVATFSSFVPWPVRLG